MAPHTERRRTDRGRQRTSVLPTRIPIPILTGPFEFVSSLISAILGVGISATALLGLHPFTRAQYELPPIVSIVWGLFLLVGGWMTMIAILRRDRSPQRMLAAESAGMMIIGAGWSIFAISPFFVPNGTLSSTVIGVLIAAASLLRVVAISVANKVTRETTALRREVS